jgi:hypothetical protein
MKAVELNGFEGLSSLRVTEVEGSQGGSNRAFAGRRGGLRTDADGLGSMKERSAGIKTEMSAKYSSGEIEALAATAHLRIAAQWRDAGRRFSTNLLAPR